MFNKKVIMPIQLTTKNNTVHSFEFEGKNEDYILRRIKEAIKKKACGLGTSYGCNEESLYPICPMRKLCDSFEEGKTVSMFRNKAIISAEILPAYTPEVEL